MDPGGGERCPVVTADALGEAAGAEQVAEVRVHPGPCNIQQPLTAEQVATEVIDDGQRVAIDAVARAELAFEVDGPDLVRGGGGEGSGARMLPPTVVPPRVGAAERSITGHIDFLQVRNGAVHILDYKPDARTNKPIAQLAIYALALTRLVPGLKLFDIKCAWFNEEEYLEIFPRTLFH